MAVTASVVGPTVDAAIACTTALLREGSERWRHCEGVAQRADELAATVVPEDRQLLVAAAWVHDIGYADDLRLVGFHPIDGAVYLQSQGWDPRLAALVAHHSGARYVAQERGLQHELDRFPFEEGPVGDALTYADQTVGPGGVPMDLQDRMTDVLRRHGPDSPNAKVHDRRGPYLLAVEARVRTRLG